MSTVIEVKRSGPAGVGTGVGVAAETDLEFVSNAENNVNPRAAKTTTSQPGTGLTARMTLPQAIKNPLW
jgi:hypothetical protein